MNRIKRLDNFWIGLLTGLLFPALVFFLYWLIFHHQINFPKRFIKYLMTGYLLSNVIKLCGLGNLVLFYFGLNYRLDKFSKGVVVSVLFYVGLIAYVTYYLEPEMF
jgi:hypothetical protein